ncbi:CBU_0592 family membrane protein [Shimia sp. MMG029]|uniref:CBU_0592 family membrane protein n=1 Tax=Shimia sp. MMG029 TaxID=3021978 RepID=UPI0022FEEFD4|nr:hypothetical protein [Shimia sp. MMG029]MDA5557170.1 hypothetical protein [Shimia sp. MMG029]
MDFLQTSFETMLTYPSLLQMIGVVGFLTYVIGFGLVQNEKVCGNGIVYPASKVFAAICVLISLVGAFNLASCLIQLSYIVIGLYGIVIRHKKNRLDNPAKTEAKHATVPENIVLLTETSSQTLPEKELGRCG